MMEKWFNKTLVRNSKKKRGIDMNIKINVLKDVKFCPYCFGTGKLKAMQSAAIYGGGSVRGKDKFVKCEFCKGTGITN